MADFPDIEANDYSFTLLANSQSYESPLTRHTQTGALAGDQWQGVVTFNNRTGLEARTLRSFILGLGGQNGRFNFVPPDLDQGGTLLGSPVVDGNGQLGSTLSTKGWDYSNDSPLKAGDYLTVNSELKLVTKDAELSPIVSYGETNYMPSPFDPSGWSGVSDPDLSYQSVTEENPSGESFVGEFEYVGPSTAVLSDTGLAGTLFNIGDVVFASIIAKSSSFPWIRIGIERRPDGADYGNIWINTDTGQVGDSSGSMFDVKTQMLSDGYRLIQAKHVVSENALHRCFVWMQGDSGGGGSFNPSIGDKIKCQAAFFGKADDWPAVIDGVSNIQFTPPLRQSPPDLSPIETEKPYMTARLENDEQASFQVSGPVIYNASFSVVEVF